MRNMIDSILNFVVNNRYIRPFYIGIGIWIISALVTFKFEYFTLILYTSGAYLGFFGSNLGEMLAEKTNMYLLERKIKKKLRTLDYEDFYKMDIIKSEHEGKSTANLILFKEETHDVVISNLAIYSAGLNDYQIREDIFFNYLKLKHTNIFK